MEETAEHAQPRLDSLPFDILRMIVWNKSLSRDDVAALRLACRGLVAVAATRLFYRISISQLSIDHDAFLSICHNPHLAEHAHEVEWLELSCDVDLFQRVSANLSISLPVSNEDGDADDAWCHLLQSQAEAAFWLRTAPNNLDTPSSAATKEKWCGVVAEFRETFLSAIDRLPNLHTFTSLPMASTRIINPTSEYPITVGFLRTFQESTNFSAPPNTNDGLFNFLMPAMERPNSTVVHLRWADEFPGYSYLRPIPSSAFKGLESMELYFAVHSSVSKLATASLASACSSAAPTMRNLTLSLDLGGFKGAIDGVEDAVLGSSLATSAECALQSLRLVSVKVGSAALGSIIQSNAKSLRHLYLEKTAVKNHMVRLMAQIPELELSSMQVIDGDWKDTIICDRALVRYINGEHPDRNCQNFDMVAGCDEQAREVVEGVKTLFIVTGEKLEDEISEAGSSASNTTELSQDSIERRLSRPNWVWERFFSGKKRSEIYCYQVHDSDPHGHPTIVWKFTSRHGEVGYGNDPLEWFDDWDTASGDIEEPTPYCSKLYEFFRDGEEAEYHMGSVAGYLGYGSKAWDFIKNQQPPPGAISYDGRMDPMVETY